MLNRHNRLLVTLHVLSDSALASVAFIVTYYLRFHTGFIPAPKGVPPFGQYLNLLPFIAVLVPLGFHLQSLYRLRRGRSRVDDFFAVFVGSILAVLLGVGATRNDSAGRGLATTCRHSCLRRAHTSTDPC